MRKLSLDQFISGQDKPIAVVLDLLTITGLNTVRSLYEKNVPVISFYQDPSSSFARTRMCLKLQSNNLNNEELINELIELGRKINNKSVLLFTSDTHVEIISNNRKILEPYYYFNLPPEDSVKLLLHKTEFQNFALKNNFSVPQTYCINNINDLSEIEETIPFPCILKPIKRTPEWNNSFYKVIRFENYADFSELKDEIFNCIDSFVIQEWIEGDDSDIYFCLVYFDSESTPLATCVGQKIRQWKPGIGTTASASKVFNQKILDETIRLFKMTDFKGLGSVEYKYDKRDNSYKIMEPTVGRPNLQSYLAVANGINIPFIAYSDLSNQQKMIVNDSQLSNNQINWINEFSELKAVNHYRKQNQITYLKWLRFVLRKKKFALFNLSDPLPFLITFKNWLKYSIKVYIKKRMPSISKIPN